MDWTKVIYVLVLLWMVACLGWGHHSGKINLWDCITTTAKSGKTFTDPKKLAYTGAFAVMAVGFAYQVIADKLTEWFCFIFVSAFVVGKWLGDREQRLGQEKKEAQ